MTAPSLAAIAAEIRNARDTLDAMEAGGDFDDCDASTSSDILALIQQLDTWANALAIVAEVGK